MCPLKASIGRQSAGFAACQVYVYPKYRPRISYFLRPKPANHYIYSVPASASRANVRTWMQASEALTRILPAMVQANASGAARNQLNLQPESHNNDVPTPEDVFRVLMHEPVLSFHIYAHLMRHIRSSY